MKLKSYWNDRMPPYKRVSIVSVLLTIFQNIKGWAINSLVRDQFRGFRRANEQKGKRKREDKAVHAFAREAVVSGPSKQDTHLLTE